MLLHSFFFLFFLLTFYERSILVLNKCEHSWSSKLKMQLRDMLTDKYHFFGKSFVRSAFKFGALFLFQYLFDFCLRFRFSIKHIRFSWFSWVEFYRAHAVHSSSVVFFFSFVVAICPWGAIKIYIPNKKYIVCSDITPLNSLTR